MIALETRILDEAMTLPMDSRASLVDKLIGSLNLPTQKEIDTAWALEAQHRLKEIKSGKVKTIPGSEVFVKTHKRSVLAK